MEQVGFDNISLNNLFNVLSIPPVLNRGTTYTAVMSPTTGSLSAMARTFEGPEEDIPAAARPNLAYDTDHLIALYKKHVQSK